MPQIWDHFWGDPLEMGPHLTPPIEPPHIWAPHPPFPPHLCSHLTRVGAVALLPGAQHVGGDGCWVNAAAELLGDDGDLGAVQVVREPHCRGQRGTGSMMGAMGWQEGNGCELGSTRGGYGEMEGEMRGK